MKKFNGYSTKIWRQSALWCSYHEWMEYDVWTQITYFYRKPIRKECLR